MEQNPYAAPDADLATQPAPRHYGGLRRFPFIGIVVVTYLAQFGAVFLNNPVVSSLLLVVILVVWLLAVIFRLQNIGSSKWWALLFLVPVVNIALMFRCIAFPEGYRHARKLDTAGKILSGIVAALIILIVAMTVYQMAIIGI